MRPHENPTETGTDPDLDDPDAIAGLDPGGMLPAIDSMPEQCRAAWQAAQSFEVPWSKPPEKIAILGLGGSAIAGDYFRALLARESPVPVFNVRSYELPAFVDERTLVIASSFSGDTEEVLSAFEQALGGPARKLAITTGGQLLATARANGVPAFTFAYRGEPRAAIGWGLMPLLAIAQKLELMQGVEAEVKEAEAVLRGAREEWTAAVPASRNEAKQLALRLCDRLPVVYGAGPLTEVARRWKTQLNESAKTWAFFEEMPETQHNAIVAVGLPEGAPVSAVFLRSKTLDHPRARLRYEFAERFIAEAGVPCQTAQARGSGALAQMLSLTMLGDYASAYLALLYGVDPTPTPVIDELKGWLVERS
jgi:glucose/mannose-6-phosphate isomerase